MCLTCNVEQKYSGQNRHKQVMITSSFALLSTEQRNDDPNFLYEQITHSSLIDIYFYHSTVKLKLNGFQQLSLQHVLYVLQYMKRSRRKL